MRVIQLSAKAGADGRLHFDIPAEAGMEFEVAVIYVKKNGENPKMAKSDPASDAVPANG